jgi:hypothetical protein
MARLKYFFLSGVRLTMKRLLSCSSGMAGTVFVCKDRRVGEEVGFKLPKLPPALLQLSLPSSETIVLGVASSSTDRAAD